MSLSQMQVFNEYVMPVLVDTIAQKIEKFNAASGGSIVLTTEGLVGDFAQRSFWAGLQSAQRRVDRYGANGAVASINLQQRKDSSVKVAGGFGPVSYEPAQMTWLQKPTAEGIEVISSEMADAILADQLNTAIAALVAAISNQAEAVNDVSASAGVSYEAMNGAHAKFGDASGNLVASVMTGTTSHRLIGLNLANAESLFEAGNINVINILGKRIVVTDAPALYEAGTPNKDKILSLTSGAAVVFDGGDIVTNIQTSNGKDRIETTMQSDYTFSVSLKGYGWDETNGGKSPSDAALATGTNWNKSMDSIKSTAGVITIGDAG